MRVIPAAIFMSLLAWPAVAATSPVAHPPMLCGGCAKLPPTVCETAGGCWHYGSFYPYGHPLCAKGQSFIGGVCVTTKPVHRLGG